jgi:hypothetical protein
MARFAIIDAGRVTNIIESDAEFAASIGAIDATGAIIGWLWDGETFTAPTPPPAIVPQSVTMRQARLALLQAGLLSNVTSAINALPSPQKEAASIEWEYSQTVERNRGFVLLLGAALGLTETQLDDLFILASTL